MIGDLKDCLSLSELDFHNEAYTKFKKYYMFSLNLGVGGLIVLEKLTFRLFTTTMVKLGAIKRLELQNVSSTILERGIKWLTFSLDVVWEQLMVFKTPEEETFLYCLKASIEWYLFRMGNRECFQTVMTYFSLVKAHLRSRTRLYQDSVKDIIVERCLEFYEASDDEENVAYFKLFKR